MSLISNSSSLALALFVAAASAFGTPSALSQAASLTEATTLRGDSGCESATNIVEVTRSSDYAGTWSRNYENPDRPAVVNCASQRFAFEAAAGVITNATSAVSLTNYLTTVATDAYIDGTDPSTPVKLPKNPAAAFAQKQPFLKELTGTIYSNHNPELGNERAVSFTAGELYFPTTAGGQGNVASLLPEGHSPLFAARESAAAVIFGLVGATFHTATKEGPALLNTTVTVGSELGRNPRGATFEGDATLKLAGCAIGVQGVQRARDGDDALEVRKGVHGSCDEILPRKIGGLEITEVVEFNRFKNRIGYTAGSQSSETAALFVQKSFPRVDLYAALSAGGNDTPIGGLPGGDFTAYGRHFKSAEIGAAFKLGGGVSFVTAYGRSGALTGHPASDYTVGDLLSGQSPGDGHYAQERGALIGLRIDRFMKHAK